MSKSKARKQREKWERQGYRNPVLNRGDWGSLNPITRKTPTRFEALKKMENKHKKRFDQGTGSLVESFFVCLQVV